MRRLWFYGALRVRELRGVRDSQIQAMEAQE